MPTCPLMHSGSVPLQPAILLGPLVKAQLQAGRRTKFSVMLRLLYLRANIQYTPCPKKIVPFFYFFF